MTDDTTAPNTEAPVTTQQRHPWKATARTVLAAALGLLSAVPLAVAVLDDELQGWELAGPGGQAIAVAGIITRIMAFPAVDRLLETVGLGSSPVVAGKHSRA